MIIHVDGFQNAPSGAGCSHVRITLTTPRGQRVFLVDRADLLSVDPPEGEDELIDRLTARLRSAIKEAGATTPAQARTAVINKDFSL